MSETIRFPVSEPIIRTGDIPALSKAVTKTCEAVGEVARQNLILAEAVSALSERIAVLEGEVVVTDFIEPYGQAMLGNAADRVLLPGYLPLQEGVNTLMVTGAEDMRLQLLLFNGSTWNSLIEFWWIPQGTKTYVHTIGVRAGETRTVSLAAPNTDLSDGHRATIQVVATPLYGAGVGFYAFTSLPSGGGRCERVSRAVRYPHDERPNPFRPALAGSRQRTHRRMDNPRLGARSFTNVGDDLAMYSAGKYAGLSDNGSRPPHGDSRVPYPGRTGHVDAHRAKAWGSNQSITVNRGIRATGRASGYSSAHTIQRVNTAKVVAP